MRSPSIIELIAWTALCYTPLPIVLSIAMIGAFAGIVALYALH